MEKIRLQAPSSCVPKTRKPSLHLPYPKQNQQWLPPNFTTFRFFTNSTNTSLFRYNFHLNCRRWDSNAENFRTRNFNSNSNSTSQDTVDDDDEGEESSEDWSDILEEFIGHAWIFKVLPLNGLTFRTVENPLRSPISCVSRNVGEGPLTCNFKGKDKHSFFSQLTWSVNRRYSCQCRIVPNKSIIISKLKKFGSNVRNTVKCSEKLTEAFPVLFLRLIVGVVLCIIVSVPVSESPSWSLTEENLLFLEAWRTIDRAYVDKNFNGQSWFRYRENALRSEPMNTREQTYAAIRKMLATLDDPFTRFLEPIKFKSLRSGTQSALTGVGVSIGYPTGKDGSPSGLVVISSAPGGPAKRAGISSGDVIMAIDDTSTETMDIYDAAERLQGPEGSLVALTMRRGTEIKHLSLTRENISLNPVKSRVCETPGSGKDALKIGYIKLTSFTQNASGAVKEAIETLRSNNVNAFVLDLRDNSGGLFPEGIEIAKIWLDKGVIVYICDSRGVRDIYDTDGSKAIAASEPLAVLVNKGTASASEILAGALKDNKRAVLLGEPTFGKGKIQSVFELSDGSGLTVTVARYETPDHIDIDKVGIIPDYPLPATFPKDAESFCGCLDEPASSCYLNRVGLFSR